MTPDIYSSAVEGCPCSSAESQHHARHPRHLLACAHCAPHRSHLIRCLDASGDADASARDGDEGTEATTYVIRSHAMSGIILKTLANYRPLRRAPAALRRRWRAASRMLPAA